MTPTIPGNQGIWHLSAPIVLLTDPAYTGCIAMLTLEASLDL